MLVISFFFHTQTTKRPIGKSEKKNALKKRERKVKLNHKEGPVEVEEAFFFPSQEQKKLFALSIASKQRGEKRALFSRTPLSQTL